MSIDTTNKYIRISGTASATSGTDLATSATTVATSQTVNGLTLNRGASAIAINNSATGTTALNLQGITRNIGSTVDFTQPSTGTITLSATNGIQTSAGTASTILTTDSGVAYGTIIGNDWAAKDSTNAWVVGLSTISGGYTAETATSLSGNADTSAGLNVALSSSTSITSLRFNLGQSRTITVSPGQTLTTGGILITGAVGVGVSTITGGNLQGAASKDLTVIQVPPAVWPLPPRSSTTQAPPA